MSRAFTFLLGKGKDELLSMLASVEKKLEERPEDSSLEEEKVEIEKALAECEG